MPGRQGVDRAEGRSASLSGSLRILHVPHAYHPVLGGAELICRKVSEILAAQGHAVQVLTTNVGAVQAYDAFGIDRVAETDDVVVGVPVKRLNFCGGFYRAGGWIDGYLKPRRLARQLAWRMHRTLRQRLAAWIAAEIARTQPDVVMTLPHLVVNVQAVLAARSRRHFPLVMVPMLHEHDPNWDIATMASALTCADAVVALTASEADRLVAAYGVSPERVFLASVGVDITSPKMSDVPRPKRIIFLGRQVRSKGIGDLIDAMCRVWPAHPDAELVVAGVRVPESAEIDTQIAALPTSWRKRVRHFGAVSDAEKATLLRSSRCLVLPSKTESFGLVILDGWAQQTPAVTWDLPVLRDIVRDGETGLLVDPDGGTEALAAAIARMLAAADEAAQMGLAGHRNLAAKYSWASVASVYLQAYDHAIRRAHNRSI